jgi:hypothetical protein
VRTQETTQKNLNKIIEFRQAIYAYGIGKRRDALFEAWDGLMLHGMKSSFPWLSMSGVFRRKSHSLSNALILETLFGCSFDK